MVSAGNIGDLLLRGVSRLEFEDTDDNSRRVFVRNALQATAYDRTLLSPAECVNGITVGAISRDLVDHGALPTAGVFTLEGDSESMPQMTSALGLGLHRAIKPDLMQVGGRQEVRALPGPNGTVLRSVSATSRTGLVAAAPTGAPSTVQKLRGTSPAAALTTRAILQSAEALTGEGGPYEGRELARRELSLLTRALVVHVAKWPQNARELYDAELYRFGSNRHARAREEVCRYFGHGVLRPDLMRRSPGSGVTLVGIGAVRKDRAQIFRMPIPPSLSGARMPRNMQITLAWFSPVDAIRAQYRLAGLEAVAADESDNEPDNGWRLELKISELDANLIKRGTVWSRRLKHRVLAVPTFQAGDDIPICVQCRDTSNGGLNPDEDIAYAIAVTLEIETDLHFNVHQEIDQALRVRLRRAH